MGYDLIPAGAGFESRSKKIAGWFKALIPGGWHSTAEALSLRTQPSHVQIWLLEKSNKEEKEMLFLITWLPNCSVLAHSEKNTKNA